jgi:hypothetical protein
VTNQIGEWRKLELQCWKDSLDNVASGWVHFYIYWIKQPHHSVCVFQKQAQTLCVSLSSAVQTQNISLLSLRVCNCFVLVNEVGSLFYLPMLLVGRICSIRCRWMHVGYAALLEWYWQGKTKKLWVYVPKISHELSSEWYLEFV